jgi:peptidyl-prolyl cis-trans isomerase A (cyclophilin A)
MRGRSVGFLAAAACLALIGCSSPNEPGRKEARKELKQVARNESAPEVFQVKLATSKGDVVIEVHRAWAPIGVDHFHALVKTGFYDGVRFFRVLRGFVVQFGINGDVATNRIWSNANLPDDPVKEHNTQGMLTYAKAGPHSRTTQLFINMKDNSKELDKEGFAPIGKVISGMTAVEFFYDGYGEMAPRGNGPDPTQIESQGNEYLASKFPRLDFIKKAAIQ